MEHHKSVLANVYDPENGEFLLRILAVIDLIDPPKTDHLPHYEVVGQISFGQPQLDKRTLILELDNSLRGLAYFRFTGYAPMYTQYHIDLQDSVWNGTDWFAKIP